MPRPSSKLIWPLAILAAGVVAIAALIATRPEVELKPPEEVTPLVRVVEAKPTTWRFIVRSQGTVEPRNETELVPQVAGEVEWISPALASGGFFAKGDPLVRIEPADYRVARATARAALARAQSEDQRAKTEITRQGTLKDKGVASQTRVDDAENAARVAAAVLDEAKARLERAERDLARTTLRAPFEGRVRRERVDAGQFVNRGESIATLYAVDFAEVSLPVPDRELRYVDVPRSPQRHSGETGEEDALPVTGPEVVLRAEFAGSEQAWQGRVVRTAGEIDPQTRMVQVVAQVADPYGMHAETEPVPLAVGLFVRAEIQGRLARDVFVLPRAALRSGNPMDPNAPEEVYVVDAEGRLHIRPVEVIRTEPEVAVVGAGLVAGDRVCVSPLRAVVEGMRVRVAGGSGTDETAAAPSDDPASAQAPVAETPAS
ncbi:MAG: efflux RND transporter periplasmic adaptor subunit [Deltaproteobacteria bacterium]|nr:efflux RND transporter periplasmic adaptor subunit [Deltaproteobacteria bacterium]MBW2392814.1 efflux RND transporter periplasmic adaptor subunit [Deltaproteobacteria bacterium]